MKPNVIGPKVLYYNPSATVLTTANITAIDEAIDPSSLKPYAYSATVREDYDARNFLTSPEATGSAVPAGQRLAVGIFLTPDNNKGNLLFQLSGRAQFSIATSSADYQMGFFFGRKATNDTVISDLTAPQNALDKFIYLPAVHTAVGAQAAFASLEIELFSQELAAGFVYCFGFHFDNPTASSHVLTGGICLAARKYAYPTSVWQEQG